MLETANGSPAAATRQVLTLPDGALADDDALVAELVEALDER